MTTEPAASGDGVDSEVRKNKQDSVIEDLQSRVLELERRLQDVLDVPRRVEMIEAQLHKINEAMMVTNDRLSSFQNEVYDRIEDAKVACEAAIDGVKCELREVTDMMASTRDQFHDVAIESALARDQLSTLLERADSAAMDNERIGELAENLLMVKTKTEMITEQMEEFRMLVDERAIETSGQFCCQLDKITDKIEDTKMELEARLQEVTDMIVDTTAELENVKSQIRDTKGQSEGA